MAGSPGRALEPWAWRPRSPAPRAPLLPGQGPRGAGLEPAALARPLQWLGPRHGPWGADCSPACSPRPKDALAGTEPAARPRLCADGCAPHNKVPEAGEVSPGESPEHNLCKGAAAAYRHPPPSDLEMWHRDQLGTLGRSGQVLSSCGSPGWTDGQQGAGCCHLPGLAGHWESRRQPTGSHGAAAWRRSLGRESHPKQGAWGRHPPGAGSNPHGPWSCWWELWAHKLLATETSAVPRPCASACLYPHTTSSSDQGGGNLNPGLCRAPASHPATAPPAPRHRGPPGSLGRSGRLTLPPIQRARSQCETACHPMPGPRRERRSHVKPSCWQRAPLASNRLSEPRGRALAGAGRGDVGRAGKGLSWARGMT